MVCELYNTHTHSLTTGKYQQCVDILTHLSKVPRFGMVAMFMGIQEKSGEE